MRRWAARPPRLTPVQANHPLQDCVQKMPTPARRSSQLLARTRPRSPDGSASGPAPRCAGAPGCHCYRALRAADATIADPAAGPAAPPRPCPTLSVDVKCSCGVYAASRCIVKCHTLRTRASAASVSCGPKRRSLPAVTYARILASHSDGITTSAKSSTGACASQTGIRASVTLSDLCTRRIPDKCRADQLETAAVRLRRQPRGAHWQVRLDVQNGRTVHQVHAPQMQHTWNVAACAHPVWGGSAACALLWQ